jgi:hypothetical protein
MFINNLSMVPKEGKRGGRQAEFFFKFNVASLLSAVYIKFIGWS